MDAWPGFGEHASTANPAPNGKTKASDKKVEEPWTFPVVDYGTLGAGILHRNAGRYGWTFAVQQPSGYKLVPARAPREVFPPTLTKRQHVPVQGTALQRVEQGAHFLRTHYPDVDVPAELIQEHITAEEKEAASRKKNDISAGNLVDLLSTRLYNKHRTYAAFPMGETGCQLNVSLVTTEHQQVVLKPATAPAYSFDTPIRHITASPVLYRHGYADSAMIGVRTVGSTTFLQAKMGRGRHQTLQVTPLTTVQRSELGDRHAVDVCVPCSGEATGYVVNNAGHVYRCAADVTEQVYATQHPESHLYRISTLVDTEELFYTSDKSADILDLRAGKQAYQIYNVPQDGVSLVSADTGNEDKVIRLVSTQEILWLDARNIRKPLLAIKHGREYDQTLQAHTYVLTNASLTFLTSRRNSLVTVYDVTREQNLVHSSGYPYALPSAAAADGPHLGHTFFQDPSLAGSKQISLFQLSAGGGLSVFDLDHLSRDDYYEPYLVETPEEWPPHVESLAQTAKPNDSGPLAGRVYSIADMSHAYQRLYSQGTTNKTVKPDVVADLLDRMPSFWQRVDDTSEHVLTTFDIAMRSGSEPESASRNDWLTGSELNSAAGDIALGQGRIPRQGLVGAAPWHLDLSSHVRRHVPDFHPDPGQMLDSLSQYDFTEAESLPNISRHQNQARSRLALDLTLASDAYLSRKPKPETSDDLDDDMLSISLSTRAMTLGDIEPRQVGFSFLRPIPKSIIPGNKAANLATELEVPLGVRLLLQEWELGSNPQEYVYQDPYDDTPAATVAAALVLPAATRPPPIVATSQPSRIRAPLVVSRSHETVPKRPASNSQPTAAWRAPPSSQEPFASTQVLPGPHGGKAPPVKKKPTKKMGGARSTSSARRRKRSADPLHGLFRGAPLIRACNRPLNYLTGSTALNETLKNYKAVVCALSASYISTFAGYPLDSIKSRLQTNKQRVSIPRLALTVYQEEGIVGFYRGLWIPLMTISFVRAASFTIYSRTKEYFRDRHWLARDRIFDVSAVGGVSGALSGSLISFGSAPFELVKVRRQLEYSIAAAKGVRLAKAPSTMEAVRDIFRTSGLMGLYTGFRLHFIRDTTGTALYFFEYDGFRYIMGRDANGEQRSTPQWLPIPASLVPFLCGSLAGVTSWALIYPLDVVKTKVQQRSLAGERPRGVFETCHRLIRGKPIPQTPTPPILKGLARVYQGLGVSALRSVTTHGLLWTFFDLTASYIDALPGDGDRDDERI
ncbi:uncharacterized protein BXZ73DRAFT_37424 [Epithele typhae]|uniref:uncharacterized protein n=1 Tax=Epithele typhae TaxID=378194 RepID=UPI002007EA59|nr:uncharacterized protein BXZ73DRAFT_37424 [Epithele typhae]KAH9945903.1 hypothetical protein BXZ73DRAFT_37424 [Epithele typhae]